MYRMFITVFRIELKNSKKKFDDNVSIKQMTRGRHADQDWLLLTAKDITPSIAWRRPTERQTDRQRQRDRKRQRDRETERDRDRDRDRET